MDINPGDLEARLRELQAQVQACVLTREEIIQIGKTREPSSKALAEWKQAEIEPLKKENEQLKEEIGGLMGKIFNREMQLLLVSNPEFSQIPFAYYGIGNCLPVSTPAYIEIFAKALNLKEEELKKLRLDKLLGYLNEKDRNFLSSALTRTERLRDYELALNSKILRLTSYPVMHSIHENGRAPIGVGLFFYDPTNPEINLLSFGREIFSRLKKVGEELYVFRYQAKNRTKLS